MEILSSGFGILQENDLFLKKLTNQVVIAQRLAWRLATDEILGSNPGKGENFLISD